MPKGVTAHRLTVGVSFPEHFSDSFMDLVSRRLLDFSSILCDEFFRDFVVRPSEETTDLTDNLIISPRLSVSDFDAKVSAALGALRRELQVP
ncbi:hypothetical protein [Acetobacter senegalensis]|uniref:hypothetical protein n=1 Tax=Acetobacter senegalensis TaxID=446692 RepID=UPI0012E82B10|nr:hypothetical protein [Acetobacter senegalensis]